MDAFSSLSINSDDPQHRRLGKKDPFEVQSMLNSIDAGVAQVAQVAQNRAGFNVASMRQALLDDLTTAQTKDVDMTDYSPPLRPTAVMSAAVDVDMQDADGLDDDVMEDASASGGDGGTPMKKLIRATNTLLSPTSMGAELALGISSPSKAKSSPRKLRTSTKSVGTSPPASPTTSAASTALSLLKDPTHRKSAASRAPDLASLSNTHYHQHHYQVSLPAPWNTPADTTEDARLETTKRLYAISSYLQIFSNAVFAAFVGYCLLSILRVFAADVSVKQAKYTAQAVAESQRCAREYVRNDCRLDARAPLLEAQCNEWEACMDADPDQAVSTMQLYAEVLAETINTFIATFALRSLVVAVTMTALVLAIIYFSNFAFGYWRAKLYYKNQPTDANTLKLQ